LTSKLLCIWLGAYDIVSTFFTFAFRIDLHQLAIHFQPQQDTNLIPLYCQMSQSAIQSSQICGLYWMDVYLTKQCMVTCELPHAEISGVERDASDSIK